MIYYSKCDICGAVLRANGSWKIRDLQSEHLQEKHPMIYVTTRTFNRDLDRQIGELKGKYRYHFKNISSEEVKKLPKEEIIVKEGNKNLTQQEILDLMKKGSKLMFQRGWGGWGGGGHYYLDKGAKGKNVHYNTGEALVRKKLVEKGPQKKGYWNSIIYVLVNKDAEN